MRNILKLFTQEINLREILAKVQVKIRLSIPFISYEIFLNEIIDPQNIDTRIARLNEIKKELESAIFAVESLQNEAKENKEEVSRLRELIHELEEDKSTAETVLKAPQESFKRLIESANLKGRMRGWIDGLIIGFLSGVLSSFAVWFVTEHIIPSLEKPSTLEETNPIPSTSNRHLQKR